MEGIDCRKVRVVVDTNKEAIAVDFARGGGSIDEGNSNEHGEKETCKIFRLLRTFFLQCWGFNSGYHTCEASTVSLSFTPVLEIELLDW